MFQLLKVISLVLVLGNLLLLLLISSLDSPLPVLAHRNVLLIRILRLVTLILIELSLLLLNILLPRRPMVWKHELVGMRVVLPLHSVLHRALDRLNPFVLVNLGEVSLRPMLIESSLLLLLLEDLLQPLLVISASLNDILGASNQLVLLMDVPVLLGLAV